MFSKYKYVYAVYTEKSFTLAAKKLYISQPSLSAAIRKIEKNLGAPLFERSNTAIELTEVGKAYIEACNVILNEEKEFERKLEDIFSLETGHITVGATNYLSCYILPEIVNTFKSIYPNISVSLVEGKSVVLEEMVKNDEIDIIIDSFDVLPEFYKGSKLLNEQVLLCLPSSWLINEELTDYRISPESIYNGSVDVNKARIISLETFKDCSFILLNYGNDMHKRAESIFSHNKIEPKVAFNVDQLNISYALAESGIGACFITDTLFKYVNFKKNVYLYNVGEQYCSRTLYVAHKKNRYRSQAMNKFIEVAHEVLGKK